MGKELAQIVLSIASTGTIAVSCVKCFVLAIDIVRRDIQSKFILRQMRNLHLGYGVLGNLLHAGNKQFCLPSDFVKYWTYRWFFPDDQLIHSIFD